MMMMIVGCVMMMIVRVSLRESLYAQYIFFLLLLAHVCFLGFMLFLCLLCIVWRLSVLQWHMESHWWRQYEWKHGLCKPPQEPSNTMHTLLLSI